LCAHPTLLQEVTQAVWYLLTCTSYQQTDVLRQRADMLLCMINQTG